MTAPPKGEPSRITISLLYLAGRPEAVPYIRPLGGFVRVGGGVLASPQADPASRLPASRGRPALFKPPYFFAPPYFICTHIGAFLPLPSGEVAMPSGIDGEGYKGDAEGSKKDAPTGTPFSIHPLSIINYQFPITCQRTGARAGSGNNTHCPEWGARRRG